jgi:hypothetical protein
MHIIKTYSEYLNESWYHGTPDSREVEKGGGFESRTLQAEYINDLGGYSELMLSMKNAREEGDEELYFKLLDKVSDYKETYTYNKPIFLTDKYSVAKTYADPMRSFDYQGAIEKVYEVDVDCNKIVKIHAFGDRFRFISEDKVKKGFIESGVSEDKIDELISKFNYYTTDNKGIKTDLIAAIGNWLGFDCIDVIGVLDSYMGGNIKSTVRMVLDTTKVKIKY